MKIGIRADINETVATGHFMRCATIADELVRKGAEVIFYSADDGVASFATERGFSYKVLGSRWDDLNSEILLLGSMKECDAILLDTYYVTREYFDALRELGPKIIYIDDIHKFHYKADAIINYSPSYAEYDYKGEYEADGTRLCLGTDYVPLRPQFSTYNDIDHEGSDFRIFITSGGMDTFGICEKIIRNIRELDAGFKIVLLAGRSYKISDYLKSLVKESFLEIYQNVSDVASIMRSCDIGITPAGTTLYELSACKVPSISYTFTDNQMADAHFFDQKGLIAYCGDFRNGEKQFTDSLNEKIADLKTKTAAQRRALGNRMHDMIDGRGAERIAEAILDETNMNKSIFILGGSMLQMPTILKAKDRGLYVYVLDYDPECDARDVADKFLLISTIDKEAVLEAAKEYKPDYIMTSTSDMPVRTASWVNEKLGRKCGISYEDSICATDKSMMRLRMKEKGVPVPDFFILESFEDFEALIKDLPDTLQKVFVLKPADNAASRGVKLVDAMDLDADKAKELWDFTSQYSRGGRVLAEEYMEGAEVSVESVTVNGITHIITITDKKVTHVPYFVETGHTEPSRLSKDEQEDIEKVALAAIKAVGIINGPSHTEIKVTKTGAKLVEIAARLGGDFITSRLVPLSSGVNLNECELDAVLGNEPSWKRVITKGSAIRFIPAKEGRIDKIQGIDEAKAMPGVEEVVLYKKEGDIVPPLHSSSDRVGHVIATGKDADEAERNCEEALSRINLVIES